MYHATMPYLRKALRELASWTQKHEVQSVALPKIAAGLGKLSWPDDVRPLLIRYLESTDCEFVVYEHFTQDMEEV